MATNFGKLNFAVAFNPQTAFPIDARCYFESLSAAQAAAEKAEAAGSSNTQYYFGQNVAVVENNVATLYIITPKTTADVAGGILKEVGSATLGDGKTIDLDGKSLSLHDFNKYYYKYTDKEGGGYEYVKTPVTDSAVLAGLEPRIVLDAESSKYVLAWYEPNKTTVEGVSSELSSLKTTVQSQGSIINRLDGDAKTEGSVKKQIADAVGKLHSFEFVKVDDKEAPAAGDKGNANTIYLYKHGEHYDEYMYFPNADGDAGTWERIGDLGDVNLTGYATEEFVGNAVKTETDRATGIENGLNTRLEGLEALKPAEAGAQANKLVSVKVLKTTGGEAEVLPITDKTVTVDLSPYAKTADISSAYATKDSLKTSVTTLEGKITTAQTNATSAANEYTDGKITEVKTIIGTLPTDAENVIKYIDSKNTATDAAIDTKISTKVGEIGSVTVKAYVDSAVSNAKTDVKTDIKDNVIGAIGDGTVKDYVDGVKTELSTVKATVDELSGDGVNSVSGKITAAIGALDVADTAKDRQFVTAVAQEDGKVKIERRALAAADIPDIATSQVTGLDAALTGKQDALGFEGTYDKTTNKVATSEWVKTQIEGATSGLTGAMHFVGTSTTDPMGESGATVENHPTFASGDVCLFGKKEFVYNGTAWSELGDEGSHAIKGAITDADIAEKAAIAQNKISGLTAALDSKLEGVTIDGTDLHITNKKVAIPMATASQLGLVKSSAAENQVKVNADGTMELNKVNANKLVQTDGEWIVLKGGTAASFKKATI